jgi:hypothetical protein
MKAKWLHESETTICMAVSNMIFFTYHLERNEESLDLDMNASPLSYEEINLRSTDFLIIYALEIRAEWHFTRLTH